jgi:hypothetical protein
VTIAHHQAVGRPVLRRTGASAQLVSWWFLTSNGDLHTASAFDPIIVRNVANPEKPSSRPYYRQLRFVYLSEIAEWAGSRPIQQCRWSVGPCLVNLQALDAISAKRPASLGKTYLF